MKKRKRNAEIKRRKNSMRMKEMEYKYEMIVCIAVCDLNPVSGISFCYGAFEQEQEKKITFFFLALLSFFITSTSHTPHCHHHHNFPLANAFHQMETFEGNFLFSITFFLLSRCVGR